MAGTLSPPSHVEAFPHLKGPALPPRISLTSDGLCGKRERGVRLCGERNRHKGQIYNYPLSEVKKTNVFLSTPASVRAANISPTPQSNSLRESPNLSRVLVLVNF